MKITVFTSNQPRHLALASKLSAVCDELYVVSETTTLFPGTIADFYKKSDVMQRYFASVIAAEERLFGMVDFLPNNCRIMPLMLGDLNRLPRPALEQALDSDVYIVFGASYIKGWLIDFLVEHKAINIHAGISPYYRGASCNFWALYDNLPHYVGATIHMLSKGLDSGPMLYHAIPKFNGENPFEFTMKTIPAAIDSLVARISDQSLLKYEPVAQDRSQEVRYTRNSAFTDEVALEFLDRDWDASTLEGLLESTKKPQLLHPYFQQ